MGSRPSSGIGGRPAVPRRIGVRWRSREATVRAPDPRGPRPGPGVGGCALRMFHASMDQKMELVFIFKKILSMI